MNDTRTTTVPRQYVRHVKDNNCYQAQYRDRYPATSNPDGYSESLHWISIARVSIKYVLHYFKFGCSAHLWSRTSCPYTITSSLTRLDGTAGSGSETRQYDPEARSR